MFLFERPTNYGEMLKKIGTFTFIIAFGLTLLAGNCSAAISNWLNRIRLPVEVWSLHIPVLYVVPALLLAILARIIRLHDKISDLFGIRERFDLNRILVPLCGAVGIPVDLPFRNKLLNRRQNAMRRTFYRYASFEDPAISKASVLGAIDVWTWYWILLEGIALLLIAAIALAVVRAYAACCVIIATAFLATLLFGTYYGICGRRADSQIEEITSDEQRVVTIRNEFNSIRQQA
jgi:hypothetical protein